MVDGSVATHAQQVETASTTAFPLLIRALSKQYATSNGEKGRVALKPLTLSL
jgi:hypothetical protein